MKRTFEINSRVPSFDFCHDHNHEKVVSDLKHNQCPKALPIESLDPLVTDEGGA